MIKRAQKSGQLRLAHEAHGFLLTHAGLHASYKYNEAPQESAAATAEWLNAHEDEDSQDQDFLAIRDAHQPHERRSGDCGRYPMA